MALYQRDYNNPTKEEFEERDAVILRNTPDPKNPKIRNSSFYREQPKAIRHFESLFPNNYLDIVDLKNETELHFLNQKYLQVVNDKTITELDIKRVIQDNGAYHIIGSILASYRFGHEQAYNFGHHGAYLFKEFKIGTAYTADYVLVGNSSGGCHFIFIECENPYNQITIANGDFGCTIRKGINQVNDWKAYLSANYSIITEEFKKYTSKQLPDEFYRFDSTRFNYIVIAGRRSDFNDKTYRLARQSREDSKLDILHYDNIYDYSEQIIGRPCY